MKAPISTENTGKPHVLHFFMIKILLTFCIVCCSSISFCQNLTLDQVIAIRPKSIGALEEYLTVKNWQMTEARDATEDTRGSVHFAFNKNAYDDTAESFLSVYYSSNPLLSNRLSIQVNRRNNYNAYMSRLKALPYKLVKSKIEDGSIIKIYKSKSIAIEVITSTSTNDLSVTKTLYTFNMANLNDYESNLENIE